MLTNAFLILLPLLSATIYHFYWKQSQRHPTIASTTDQIVQTQEKKNQKELTALQQHVIFWDRDNDGIINPQDVYTGFRDIGFSIPFSLASLLIPVFFSYPTRLAHSYLLDPFFRIYISSIHKAKHGSDTGIYDNKGNFRAQFFEQMFAEFDPTDTASLGARDLLKMIGSNRMAADPAGWSFSAMEWGSTWVLLQREGRVGREDLRGCYDGTLFWRLKSERERGVESSRGYGWRDFCSDCETWARNWWWGGLEQPSSEEIAPRI